MIGGDNIIDNVAVSTEGTGLTIDGGELVSVGGCVGLVGGDDCLKGGGVIFRNMTGAKLTTVSAGQASIDVTTEVAADNKHYYWNPYVGRVLDGYACANAALITQIKTTRFRR